MCVCVRVRALCKPLVICYRNVSWMRNCDNDSFIAIHIINGAPFNACQCDGITLTTNKWRKKIAEIATAGCFKHSDTHVKRYEPKPFDGRKKKYQIHYWSLCACVNVLFFVQHTHGQSKVAQHIQMSVECMHISEANGKQSKAMQSTLAILHSSDRKYHHHHLHRHLYAMWPPLRHFLMHSKWTKKRIIIFKPSEISFAYHFLANYWGIQLRAYNFWIKWCGCVLLLECMYVC